MVYAKSFLFGFLLFGSTPFLMRKTQYIPTILSLLITLAPFMYLIISIVGFYNNDPEMGTSMAGATLGWWLAVFYLKNKK